MQLSVVSALARLSVDPWEEANHLAAMPKAEAERALVAKLDRASGRSWIPSEAEATAARLVRLLPQDNGPPATSAGTEIAAVRAQRTGFWLVWLCIAMAVSFLSPHHQATTTNAAASTEAPTPLSEAKAAPKIGGVEISR